MFKFISLVTLIALSIASAAFAQQGPQHHSPSKSAQPQSVPQASPHQNRAPAINLNNQVHHDDSWRYARHDGRWLYWNDGRWLVSLNGAWVPYTASTYAPPVVSLAPPAVALRPRLALPVARGPYYEDANGFYLIDSAGARAYDPTIHRD